VARFNGFAHATLQPVKIPDTGKQPRENRLDGIDAVDPIHLRLVC